ncbi:MAG: hypothetical protein WBV77_07935 [Solirubrobacteraceae bacterium]|jgi:hypothetical protein
MRALLDELHSFRLGVLWAERKFQNRQASHESPVVFAEQLAAGGVQPDHPAFASSPDIEKLTTAVTLHTTV